MVHLEQDSHSGSDRTCDQSFAGGGVWPLRPGKGISGNLIADLVF